LRVMAREPLGLLEIREHPLSGREREVILTAKGARTGQAAAPYRHQARQRASARPFRAAQSLCLRRVGVTIGAVPGNHRRKA